MIGVSSTPIAHAIRHPTPDTTGHGCFPIPSSNWKLTPRFWREGIINRNRLLDFSGKKFKREIDSMILAGRNSKWKSTPRFWREETIVCPLTSVLEWWWCHRIVCPSQFKFLTILIPKHIDILVLIPLVYWLLVSHRIFKIFVHQNWRAERKELYTAARRRHLPTDGVMGEKNGTTK